MPLDTHSLIADSTVATAPAPTTSGTTLTLTTGEGARFPPAGGFDVLICPAGQVPIWASGTAVGGNFEICRATRSGDVLTLTRAQYATTARAVLVGDRVFQPLMPHDLTCTYSTTLPASPGDGDEAILVDNTTSPTYQWRFRYHAGSTSSYKWEFIGGSEITAYAAATVTATSLAILGPSIVVPRAGEYMVEVGCAVSNTVSGGLTLLTATNLTETVQVNSPGYWDQVVVRGRATYAASGSVGLAGSAATGGGTASFQYRRISILPIRVS